MTKLQILKGPTAGRTVEINPAGFTIGRVADNDLVLDEEGVSRHHCRLSKVEGTWQIEDLGSLNGVLVNGVRLTNSAPLFPGDELQILSHVLVFSPAATAFSGAVDPEAAVPAAAAAADKMPPRAPLSRSSHGGPLPVGRLLLLGLLLALIIGIIYVAFFAGAAGHKGSAQESGSSLGTTANAPPAELSDAELNRLIEQEERQAGNQNDTTRDTFTAESQPPPAGETATTAPPPGADPFADTPARQSPAPGREAPQAITNVVLVESVPPGAMVTINGTEQGTTPLVARGLREGRHMLRLILQGYEELERQIHVPDALPTRAYVLRQKPGTLLLTSTPTGAAVWHGTQFLGCTPLLLDWLAPGSCELRLAAAGCEPTRLEVQISDIRGETAHAELRSLLGELDIRTEPPGCRVLLDGLLKGHTIAAANSQRLSAPFRLSGLPAGDHQLLVEHPSGIQRRGSVRIQAGEVTRQPVKLWIPNCRLVLSDGTPRLGMLAEVNEHGDVVLEEKPGQYERYLKPRLAEVLMLTPEQTRDLVEQLRGGQQKNDATADETKIDPQRGPAQTENAAPQPTEMQPPQAGWTDQATPPPPQGDQEMRLGPRELRSIFKNASNTEIHNRLNGKTLVLNAVPTSAGRDGLGGYVAFGRRVRCFMSRDDYETMRDRIRAAIDGETPLTMHGTSQGMRGDVLILRDSELLEGEN